MYGICYLTIFDFQVSNVKMFGEFSAMGDSFDDSGSELCFKGV